MKKELLDSIKHWDRMIDWANKQDKTLEPLPETRDEDDECIGQSMQSNLGETWWGGYCALCKKYNNEPYHLSCAGCPFIKVTGTSCEEMGWRKVSNSPSWGEWVKNAKDFVGIMHQIYGELYHNKEKDNG